MSIKTVAKTSIVVSIMALSMVQLQSVLVNQARGQAPLTAPITAPIQLPLTPPVQNNNPEPPLTAPQQDNSPSVTPTPTVTPTVTPTPVPANNNSGGSSNNGGGGGNNGGGGGSSNNGGSNGGGSNVCRDEKPKSSPIILSARATGANQVTLVWKKGWAPFNGYVISYGTKHGITQYTSDIANTTSATIGGLNGSTLYYFRVQAKNGCVAGDYSRELSVRTYGKTFFSNKILGSKIKKTTTVKTIKPVTSKKTK